MAAGGMVPKDVDAYLKQWLETATGGKVVYQPAVLTNRLVFTCLECGATAKCASPKDSTTIDYYIREFVNLHAHKEGHTRLIDKEMKAMIDYKKQMSQETKKISINTPPAPTWMTDGFGFDGGYGNGNWQPNTGGGSSFTFPPMPIDNIPSGLPIPVGIPVTGGSIGTIGTAPPTGNVIIFPHPPYPQQYKPYVPSPPEPAPAPVKPKKALKPKTGRRFR